MLGPDRPLFKVVSAGPKHAGATGNLEQVLAVRQFVSRVGGLENARKALAMLKLLKKAA